MVGRLSVGVGRDVGAQLHGAVKFQKTRVCMLEHGVTSLIVIYNPTVLAFSSFISKGAFEHLFLGVLLLINIHRILVFRQVLRVDLLRYSIESGGHRDIYYFLEDLPGS